jgi:hypothetical protein
VVASIKRGSGRSHARLRIAALLAGVSLSAVAAHAQNATWQGPGHDWDKDSNWIGGAQPTNTAEFNGATPKMVTFSKVNTSINTILFDPSPLAYTFKLGTVWHRQ